VLNAKEVSLLETEKLQDERAWCPNGKGCGHGNQGDTLPHANKHIPNLAERLAEVGTPAVEKLNLVGCEDLSTGTEDRELKELAEPLAAEHFGREENHKNIVVITMQAIPQRSHSNA
jgi:hypothetical protein